MVPIVAICLNCGSTKGQPHRFGYSGYRLITCGNCGITYWPAWGNEFDQSHDLYYQNLIDTYVPNPITQERLRKLFIDLGKRTSGRKFLDVGCGLGEAVNIASQNGWKARGIDLSSAAIAICQRRSLNCEEKDFFELSVQHGSFDLIMLTEVIEHVPHPQKWLAHSCDLLGPEGLVYLTTPNFNSLGRRILENDWHSLGEGHIAYYNARTLLQIATSVGLEAEHVSTRNPSVAAIRKLIRLDRRKGLARAVQYQQTQRIRELSTQHISLKLLKGFTNSLLDLTGLGETLVIRFRKLPKGPASCA